MEKVLCCLYDKVANKYFAPSCFDNEECAKRDAYSLFTEHMGKRCKDYAVFVCGYFDDSTGCVQSHTIPYELVLDGASVVFEKE